MSDPAQDSAAEAKVWVESNQAVVDRAFQHFLESEEWPGVTESQRYFDRRGIDVDVQEVVDSKPRAIGEARLAHPDRVVLQLRDLMWVESARSVINICVTAVTRAIESYLSDDEQPSVSSEDNLTNFPSDRAGGLRDRAFALLTHEFPSPFGGYTRSESGWRIDVDPRFVRRFKDVHSVEDFVASQDAIRAETVRETVFKYPDLVLSARGEPVDFFSDGSFTDESPPEGEVPAEAQDKPVLFLSWGRTSSKAVAAELKPILESRLPGVEVFFSATSIEPGSDPSRRMFDEGLLASEALVVVLTEASAVSAYVIWETATAWAREQLVIPVFVGIEPDSVPGPLTSKIQGVHLNDREDMDRGLKSLSARFSTPPPTPLTIQEHQALLQAAETEDERNPDDERRSLVNQLRGYVARWASLVDSFEGSWDASERVNLAAEIQQVLNGAIQIAVAKTTDPAFATALSTIARQAAEVKRIRVYADGGNSFAHLDQGCRDLVHSVSDLFNPEKDESEVA
jgi:hypothetical protein